MNTTTHLEIAQSLAATAQQKAMTSGLDVDWDRYEELRAECHRVADAFFMAGGYATITQTS